MYASIDDFLSEYPSARDALFERAGNYYAWLSPEWAECVLEDAAAVTRIRIGNSEPAEDLRETLTGLGLDSEPGAAADPELGDYCVIEVSPDRAQSVADGIAGQWRREARS